MVDLNEWRLEYEGVSFDFGTHESGFPFTKQVVIGPVTIVTDDLAHPLTDGQVFGEDRTRGRSLIFNGAVLSQTPRPSGEARWTAPLDGQDVISRVWGARRVRRRAGAVAQLANLERGRCVYGRPRNHTPDLEKVRGGWSTYSTEFITADDKFYALVENMVTAGVAPESLGGYTFSTTFPMSTFGVAASEAPGVPVGGTEETWPVVAFKGPANNPTVTVKDSTGAILWTIALQATLTAWQTALIDCRPWSRGVTVNGEHANGILRASTKLDECWLPPGEDCELLAYGVVPQNGASATLWWRDAFASL